MKAWWLEIGWPVTVTAIKHWAYAVLAYPVVAAANVLLGVLIGWIFL